MIDHLRESEHVMRLRARLARPDRLPVIVAIRYSRVLTTTRDRRDDRADRKERNRP